MREVQRHVRQQIPPPAGVAHTREPRDARLAHDRAREPRRQHVAFRVEREDVRRLLENAGTHRLHDAFGAVETLEPVVHEGRTSRRIHGARP